MRSGFHQLTLDPASQLRTAFWWGSELWCYTRLPFGLKNSSAIYQRVMDSVLSAAGLRGFAAAFIDDVIIWSDTPEQHVQHVQAVLQALAAQGLKAHPDKSIFMAEGVEFLGHVVSPQGLHPSAARVAAFKQLQLPRTKDELASQLGMLGFYRCYLPAYSSIAEPLRKMRKKDSPAVLQWDEETRVAYQELLEGLTQEGRFLRRADVDQPFTLHTDWSTKGLGAILSQVDSEGKEGVVACISRSLNEHEQRYPAWKGELLAVVWAVKQLKPYLAGRDFTVVTDHRPLLWLMSSAELAGQQERWVLALQEFSFSVQHRAGSNNPADLPSRYPCTSTADPTGARLDEAGSLKRVLPKVIFATEEARQQAIAEFIAGSSVAQPGAAAALVQQRTPPWYQPAEAVAAATWQLCNMVSSLQPVAAAVVGHVAGGVDLEDGECPAEGAQQQGVAVQLQRWAQQLQRQVASSQLQQRHLPAFYDGLQGGVVVVELFGGLCAGLEACLRNGWVVRAYRYVDRDPVVRKVAYHRMAQLLAQYPQQLSPSSFRDAMAWPQDVHLLGPQQVQQLGDLGGNCVLWAGWECQDLSAAGSGRGLAGPRSSTFYPLHRFVQHAQQQLGECFAYVLENTAMSVPWQRSAAVLQDFQQLQQQLGPPLQLDAAQFGSRAHRLRCFWTNLAPQPQLAALLAAAQRPPGRTVQKILEPGRRCRPVSRDDAAPFYPCNRVGQPMEALPTLMATVGSYAFRGQGAGTIWDDHLQTWTEPTAGERELALGYRLDSTAAAGVTPVQRHQVLGRSMDANTVAAIVAAAAAVARQGGCGETAAAAAAQLVFSPCQPTAAAGEWEWAQFLGSVAAAATAQQQERGSADIWHDAVALGWLQTGQWPAGQQLTRQEQNRVRHRARLYRWQQDQLYRCMPDGSTKLVPQPEARSGIIQRIHQQTGHYGARRTSHMVAASHWWRTLRADVQEEVRRCSLCDRVKAGFNSLQPQLQPLAIEPMFYRWGYDLAGEFPVTSRGNKWVLIAVEHFSKHIELIPLRSKSATETAAAAAQILCRFGAPAEVVTDGGGEWEAEFDQLLASCFIDHRLTSPHHPQANGLAERIVQVAKRSLRKLCEGGRTAEWDLQLPWVALGYRCSKQSSTGFSPYELLYARQPVFPSAIQDKMQEPLDCEDQAAAAASILRRAKWLEERIPVAAANLAAAQHRDTLRYQQLRSKGYLPKVAAFQVGDTVYLRRPKQGSTLMIKARPVILRVKQLQGNGVAVLQDRAGQEFKYHVSQLAPCHLPDVDTTVDRGLKAPDQQAECVGCGSPDDEELFLYCDHCGKGWHTYCCTPPLVGVPQGHFLCELCSAEGVTMTWRRRGSFASRCWRRQGCLISFRWLPCAGGTSVQRSCMGASSPSARGKGACGVCCSIWGHWHGPGTSMCCIRTAQWRRG
jgi:site-specific DNA-cytosine methylase